MIRMTYGADERKTHNNNNCQILEDCIEWYAQKLLLGDVNATGWMRAELSTHQTLRPGIYYADKRETYRKPCLCILHVKISK